MCLPFAFLEPRRRHQTGSVEMRLRFETVLLENCPALTSSVCQSSRPAVDYYPPGNAQIELIAMREARSKAAFILSFPWLMPSVPWLAVPLFDGTARVR